MLEGWNVGEMPTLSQLHFLLYEADEKTVAELKEKAASIARSVYGNRIFVRGLLEFTNYCKNDCLYCGIRRSNAHVERYRLSKEQLLACCEEGYEAGFRTFVLQGGEDPFFTEDILCDIISSIKKNYPDCAVTLSVGEKSRQTYEAYFKAGADRYLLRHETADAAHYDSLHPKELTLSNRLRCLEDLKAIGFQTGCGFMVGSPGQTVETLYQDLLLLHKLQPEMVGIGPFIPHKDTPFAAKDAGSVELTLRLLAIVRLLLPTVLLPATTALNTLDEDGRNKGILSGANVIMLNISPAQVRQNYMLYDGKRCTGDEAIEHRRQASAQISSIGYELVTDRGDVVSMPRKE